MTLWSLDEARAEVVRSAIALLTGLPVGTEAWPLLWGAGPTAGLTTAEAVLAGRHRATLDAVVDQGYGWAADEELEGVASLLETEGVSGLRVLLGGSPGWS